MTGRKRVWAGLLFTALLVAGCRPADLRPDENAAGGPIAGRSPEAIAVYLDALGQMGVAGPVVAPPTISLTGVDLWHVSFFRWLTPLTESPQQFRFHSRPGEPLILFQFTSGRRTGETIGIDARGTFEGEGRGGRRSYKDSSSIRLYLEPMKNYLEWPISLFNSPVLVPDAPRVINDEIHEVLFASSGSGDPSKTHDHYRIFIHRESKRVAFIEFTLRALWPSYKGALHYGDFRHIDGFVFPFRIAVSDSVEDRDFVHTFVFDHIEVTVGRYSWDGIWGSIPIANSAQP
jgi:hypothetical protein